MRRREILAAVGLGTAGLALGAGRLRAEDKVARIGFQKYGTLTLLKERGTLEPRLASQGFSVTWTEFPAGPQLLEGLNVGAIDFGTVGEAPPIFAQAAGAALLYVGYEPAAPQGEAILVPSGSPIRTVGELKGKKVALNKGSNVHYLLVKALEQAKVGYGEIEPVYLPPADARAAFEQGAVDAWVIWDPFLAAAQAATGARTLIDGTGLVSNHQFYLASQGFAGAQPAVVNAIIEELVATDSWAAANVETAAKLFGPKVGIPAAILQPALQRMGYGVKPLTDEVVAEQQHIADAFYALKLLPKPITVRDVVWKAAA